MTELLALFGLCFVVIYMDGNLTAKNWGTKYNGIGAIDNILEGKALQPMQYRVLIPWLCAISGRGDKNLPYQDAYISWRSIAIIFAIMASWVYFSAITAHALAATTILVIFFIVAADYDYTDVYVEVGLFAVCFTMLLHHVSPFFVAPFVTLAVLNREGGVFIVACLLLSGDWWGAAILGLAAAIGLAIPRLRYGKADRYCEFVMWKKNVRRIRQSYGGTAYFLYNRYTVFFVLLAVVIGAFLVSGGPTAIEWGMGLMFLALLVPSMWFEIRVFAPVMLAVIPILVGKS